MLEVADADAPLFLVPPGGFLQRGGRCWMVEHPLRLNHAHQYHVVPPLYAANKHGAPGFYIEDVETHERHLVVLD